MKQKGKLLVVLIVTVSLCIGCANIKDDATRTRMEGVFLGAALIGGTGLIIGLLTGNKKTVLYGALAGMTVGVLIGLAYGNHVVSQKKKFASEEAWLDACTAEAKKVNKDIAAYKNELSRQIDNTKKEIAVLEKKQKNAQLKQAGLKEKKLEVNKMLTSTETKLKLAKKELEAQQIAQFLSDEAKKNKKGDHVRTMNSEMETLKANIVELEKRTETLAALSASMAV